MQLTLTNKYACDMTTEEYEWCRTNNLGDRGRIRDELDTASYHGEASPTRVVLARDEENNLVGWAIIFRDSFLVKTDDACGFFVPETHRRKGIGTALAKECIALCERPVFYPDREERALFFANFRGQFRCPRMYAENMKRAA